MIIGALGLALGQRAHADMLRADDKPTLVEALFDVTAYPHLPELFNTLGITVDDASLLLKRVLTKSGSRCYINAQLATVAMLQQAGQYRRYPRATSTANLAATRAATGTAR